MRGRRSALGLVCAALLVAVPGADAATVAIVQGTFGGETVFVAAPGERNNVVLAAEATSSGGVVVTVSDSGAALTPGSLCQAISEHVVQCRDFANFFASVDLGDRDDEFNSGTGGVPAIALELRGGPDDDVIDASSGAYYHTILDGGAGNDRVIGGVGPEELHGGGGADTLSGGGGDDTLTDDDVDGAAADLGPGPDTVDGGDGVDVVSYRRRTAPVHVDLADAATDGTPGEGDRLTNVESLVGGRGDDRLAGDDRPNVLDGRSGRDRLIGRGGADELRRADGRVSCGDQRDRVVWHRAFDALLAPDCELLMPDDPFGLTNELFAGVKAHPTAASGTALHFRVWCPLEFDNEFEEEVTAACEGPLTVRERNGDRRTLATGDLPSGAWYGRRLTARLTPLGRRLATRRRGVLARVRLAGYFPTGEALVWTIRVNVPR